MCEAGERIESLAKSQSRRDTIFGSRNAVKNDFRRKGKSRRDVTMCTLLHPSGIWFVSAPVFATDMTSLRDLGVALNNPSIFFQQQLHKHQIQPLVKLISYFLQITLFHKTIFLVKLNAAAVGGVYACDHAVEAGFAGALDEAAQEFAAYA